MTEPTLREVVAYFGHDYDIDGRQEWHSLNCLYRKTWPMGGNDNPGCVQARAALAATPPPPTECGICGHYSAAGVEVHEACLAATPPPLDRDALARAVLVAAQEEGRRTDDRFEWYGSADEMAEGILRALTPTGDET